MAARLQSQPTKYQLIPCQQSLITKYNFKSFVFTLAKNWTLEVGPCESNHTHRLIRTNLNLHANKSLNLLQYPRHARGGF